MHHSTLRTFYNLRLIEIGHSSNSTRQIRKRMNANNLHIPTAEVKCKDLHIVYLYHKLIWLWNILWSYQLANNNISMCYENINMLQGAFLISLNSVYWSFFRLWNFLVFSLHCYPLIACYGICSNLDARNTHNQY